MIASSFRTGVFYEIVGRENFFGSRVSRIIPMTKPQCPKLVFNVVSKDPEVAHHADQVKPSTMEKHRRDVRYDDGWQGLLGVGPVNYLRRNHTVLVQKELQVCA